jgi:hypothetical protein
MNFIKNTWICMHPFWNSLEKPIRVFWKGNTTFENLPRIESEMGTPTDIRGTKRDY